MPEIKSDPVEIAQRWQEFRVRCIELALKSGAPSDQVLDLAKTFETYVITKSSFEAKTTTEKVDARD